MATVRFQVECPYSCDVATVHRTVTDRAYLEAALPACGGRDVQVIIATPRRVETIRTVEAQLPAFARKVLGDTNTLAQTEEWDSAGPDRVRGTFSVRSSGTPVTIDGTSEIVADGDGCQVLITGAVVARVPVVGGKIANIVARQVERSVSEEHAFTVDWIKNHA